MNEDKTLGERINTIFREQDITIVSTLTAISLAISTIVASILDSVASVIPIPSTPVPPTLGSGGVKEWIQKNKKIYQTY